MNVVMGADTRLDAIGMDGCDTQLEALMAYSLDDQRPDHEERG